MGAWGIPALESDNGLDAIAFLEDFIEQQAKDKVDLTLSQVAILEDMDY